MSETPSRRAGGWTPGDDRQSAPGPTPWEPRPRTAQRPVRDDRARGGYDDGYGQQPRSAGRAAYSDGYDDDDRPRRGARPGGYDDGRDGGGSRGRRGQGHDDGYGPVDSPDGYDGYDDDYDDTPARSGARRAAGAARSTGTRSRGSAAAAAGPELPLGQRLGIAFAIGAVPSLLIAFLCGTASAGGSSRSIAGVTLNSQLLMYSALAIPATILVIGGLLRWRQVNPLGLTWGFAMVSGLSWLALLFAAQVKNVIPHLTPLLTVPLLTGAAVAAGAYLTDERTTASGRYACLAAVIASHIGIVAIVVTIVLA
jgi:hypothetical protein